MHADDLINTYIHTHTLILVSTRSC